MERRTDSRNGILDGIYKEVIALDDEKTKRAKSVLKVLVQNLMETMKEVDILFREIYQRIYYTCSFYDGLRVGEATEFDLNVVMGLRVLGDSLKPRNADWDDADVFDVVPGFAVLHSHKSF